MKIEILDYITSAVKYEPMGTCIYFSPQGNEWQKLLDIRGWGRLSTKYGTADAIDIQDKIGFFVADAINEKINKEKAKNEN